MSERVTYRVGEVVYIYDKALVPARVGQRLALPNGQLAEVLTAKCSDGAIEARKLTARVLTAFDDDVPAGAAASAPRRPSDPAGGETARFTTEGP